MHIGRVVRGKKKHHLGNLFRFTIPAQRHDFLYFLDDPCNLLRRKRMMAAGRGIYVGSELGIRPREQIWRSVCNYYPLKEPESYFDWFAVWKKAS